MPKNEIEDVRVGQRKWCEKKEYSFLHGQISITAGGGRIQILNLSKNKQ